MAIVTTTVVKQHLRISHTAEDDLLDIMIDAAQEFVADLCNVYFHAGDGSVTENLDGGAEQLWPTRLPIQSVTSVLDLDASNASYDFEYSDTRILRDTKGYLWPDGAQRWQVTYTAGYDSTTAPSVYKLSVLDLVARAYNSRGGRDAQSGQGYSLNWQSVMNSDIAKRLRGASYRRAIG